MALIAHWQVPWLHSLVQVLKPWFNERQVDLFEPPYGEGAALVCKGQVLVLCVANIRFNWYSGGSPFITLFYLKDDSHRVKSNGCPSLRSHGGSLHKWLTRWAWLIKMALAKMENAFLLHYGSHWFTDWIVYIYIYLYICEFDQCRHWIRELNLYNIPPSQAWSVWFNSCHSVTQRWTLPCHASGRKIHPAFAEESEEGPGHVRFPRTPKLWMGRSDLWVLVSGQWFPDVLLI